MSTLVGNERWLEEQQAEFASEAAGYTATRHQREVGTGYFDAIATALSGGRSSTVALEESTEALRPGLTDLTSQLSAISTSTREISHGLYPRQLEYVGLATAVKKLCEEMRRGNRFAVDLAMENVPRQLESSVSLCLYRVVQETFHNVMSHSQAKRVQVELGADHRRILLRIFDDGVGFEPSRARSGLGLASMRQRVRSVGGSIEIDSSPMGGTRVEVWVPLREHDAGDMAGAA